MSKEKEVSRRGYVKYAAAGIIVVAGAAVGGYYATRPRGPAPPPATQVQTVTEVQRVTETKPVETPEEGVELSIVFCPCLHTPANRLMADEWSEKTGIKVNVVSIPFELEHDKFAVELASQSPALDLIEILPDWGTEYAATGNVINLTQFAKDNNLPDNDPEDFVITLKDHAKYEGDFYAFPDQSDVMTMFYRKDILEELGYGTFENPEPPETWDDYYTFCQEVMTKKDQFDPPVQYGGSFPFGRGTEPAYTFMSVGWAMGGDWLDPVTYRCVLDSPEIKDSLQFYVDLYNEGLIPKDVIIYQPHEAGVAVARALSASAMQWPWVEWLSNEPSESDVVGKVSGFMLPVGPPGEKVPPIRGWLTQINAATRYPKEAYDLLSYITNIENTKRRVLVEGSFTNPTRETTLADAEVMRSYGELGGHPEWYGEYIRGGRVFTPRIPEFYAISDIMGEEINLALAGQRSPSAACDSMKVRVDELLKGKGYFTD